MATVTHGAARRPRAYVRVHGPDAVIASDVIASLSAARER